MSDIEALCETLGWDWMPQTAWVDGTFGPRYMWTVQHGLTGDGTVAVLEWLIREHGCTLEVNETQNGLFQVIGPCEIDFVRLIAEGQTLPEAALAAALEIVKDE